MSCVGRGAKQCPVWRGSVHSINLLPDHSFHPLLSSGNQYRGVASAEQVLPSCSYCCSQIRCDYTGLAGRCCHLQLRWLVQMGGQVGCVASDVRRGCIVMVCGQICGLHHSTKCVHVCVVNAAYNGAMYCSRLGACLSAFAALRMLCLSSHAAECAGSGV